MSETAGVLNAIVSAVASLQVADALRILSGQADLMRTRITTMDVWNGGIRQTDTPARDPDCPTCGRREFRYLEEASRPPVTLCGRNAVQIHERAGPVDLVALRARLEPLGQVRANEFALRFLVAPYEMTVFADGSQSARGSSITPRGMVWVTMRSITC